MAKRPITFRPAFLNRLDVEAVTATVILMLQDD